MQASGWIQLVLFVVALVAITKPMGLYLMRVLDANGKTWLDIVLKPLERVTYRLMGVDPGREQDWKQYTFAMLLFSMVGLLFTYAILRLQHLLPLNPQGFGPLSVDLAFNTAVSFATNTNWQSYGGESTMSYFSQLVALALHNFVSAATGAFDSAEALVFGDGLPVATDEAVLTSSTAASRRCLRQRAFSSLRTRLASVLAASASWRWSCFKCLRNPRSALASAFLRAARSTLGAAPGAFGLASFDLRPRPFAIENLFRGSCRGGGAHSRPRCPCDGGRA